MTPFFKQNLTPNAPFFHTPVGTCMSLSYSSVSPPRFSAELDTHDPPKGHLSPGDLSVNMPTFSGIFCGVLNTGTLLLDN